MKQKRLEKSTKLYRDVIIFGIVLAIVLLAGSGLFTFDLRSRAKMVPADIKIDTSIIGADLNTEFYHAFAQGGEESKDMLTPVLSELKGLKPKLIRLDHIYDAYTVVSRVDGKLVFDFSRLDGAVSPILESGAVPMLSLSYMPPAIASEGKILNAPGNWNEWSLVVQKTVEHYSGIRQKNIAGVYYEVWNEPDLAQFGDWDIRGPKNYLTLYRYASIGATNARRVGTNGFFFGGPVTTGFYPNWLKAMIASGEGFDFISWHDYGSKPEIISKNLQDARTILDTNSAYKNVQLIISEFGFTGARDKRYGTVYSAAHAASVIKALVTNPPKYLVSFEVKDGPGQEAGDGWGLLSHETNGTKKKPRYSVYEFLDLMAGRRVSLSGEGSDVTGWAAVQGNVYKVLLVNFNTSGFLSQNAPVTFQNISPGSYKLRQKYFLGVDGVSTVEASQSSFTKLIYMPAPGIVYLSLERLSL